MSSDKKAGCLKGILFTIILFVMIFTAFYFIIWRVPDNSKKIDKQLAKLTNEMEQGNNIPKAQNGWYDYEKASARIRTLNVKVNQQKIDDVLKKGIKEEDRDYISELRLKNREALELIEKGYAREYFFVPIKFREGANAKTPQYLALRNLAQMLAVFGELSSIEGNYRDASEYFLEGLHMGAGMGSNHTLMGGLIGIAVIMIDLEPLREMIVTKPVDADTLRHITKELVKIDKNMFMYKDLVGGELVIAEFTFDWVRTKQLSKLIGNTGPSGSTSPSQLMLDLVPRGAFVERERKIYENWYLNRIELIKDYRKILDRSYPDYKFPPLSVLTQILVPNMDRALGHYLFSSANLRGTIILSALECYKTEKGDYPDDLSKLVPDYLPEIPKDPLSKNDSFVYKKEADGVFLYSYGTDLKDDGANIKAKKPTEGGDIVFLTPRMVQIKEAVNDKKTDEKKKSDKPVQLKKFSR